MANNFVDRVSSMDSGYTTGDLSVYPAAPDTQLTLYQVKNNAETKLSQTITYTSRYLIVDDTSSFPDAGVIKVGDELIYYEEKTSNIFRKLKRGFAGSRQGQWADGTVVVNTVFADTHNAVKDAIFNLENNIGTEEDPSPTSLNGILKNLENKYLAPKPLFRASPLSGQSPLKVAFQNFSTASAVRYLWDFGDGGTSVEAAPTHTYAAEGTYTVKLNVITSLGAQGVVTKTDYITVDDSLGPHFFYVTPLVSVAGTTFNFVDQTSGDVANRYWIFDDGQREDQSDPDVHYTTHAYSAAGTYNPTLIIVMQDGKLIRLQLPDPVVVT